MTVIGLASTMSERRLTLARNGEMSLMLLMERSKCRSSVHLSKLGHIAVTIITQFTGVHLSIYLAVYLSYLVMLESLVQCKVCSNTRSVTQ